MTLISTMTHLAAGLGGVLLTLWTFAKRLRITRQTEELMSNKFISILKEVGKGLLWLVTNKAAQSVENDGLTLAEIVWPGLDPILDKLQAAVAKAYAQAQVSTVGLTPEQIVALVVSDVQSDLATAGITEPEQMQNIVTAMINLLDQFPSGTVNATIISAAAATETAAAKAAPEPAAAGAAPGPVPVAAVAQATDEPRLQVPA